MKNKRIWTRIAAFVLAAMLVMSESSMVTLAEDNMSTAGCSVEETYEEAAETTDAETEEAMSQDANMVESAGTSPESQDEDVVDTSEETEEILTASEESLFSFDSSTGEITGFADGVTSVQTDIVIPSTIGGVAVKGIKENAFRNSNLIGDVYKNAKLTIPSTIEYIGYNAFSNIKYLGEIIFESGSTEIKLNGPNGNAGTFADCTGLTSVTLSNRNTEVSGYMFDGCTSLKTVNWSPELTKIGDNAFYAAALTEVDLSECTKLTEIGSYAFRNMKSVKKVKLPANLKKIGSCAFRESTLGDVFENSTLTIPGTVVFIGFNAFSDCEYLGEVVFEEGEGEIIFEKAGFMCESTFCNNPNLKKVTLSNKVTNLGVNAFLDDANLAEVVWNTELLSIGESCFKNTGLKSLDLSKCLKLKSIGSYAFQNNTELINVVLPDNLQSIGSYAFSSCPMGSASQLGRLVIPGSVKSVGSQAFNDCTYLGEVVFETGSDSLIEFGNLFTNYGTFNNCENLKGIKFSNCAGDIGSDMLAGTPALAHIYIAYDKAQIYENLANQKFNTTPTVYCNAGSSAEAFAKKAGFKVKSLAEYPQISLGTGGTEPGDDFDEDFKDEVTEETLTVTTTVGEAFGPLKEAPAKEGYVFAGWSLEKDNENAIVTEETIAAKTGEQTLYAIYEEMVLLKGQQYNVNAYFKEAIDQYTKDCTKNNFTPTYKFKCVSRKTENATSKGKASVSKKTGMLKATAAGNVTVILQVKVLKNGKKVYVDYYTLDLTVIDASIKPITLTKFSMSANAINDGNQTGGITYISKMKDVMGMPTTPDELNTAKVTYTYANEKSMQYIKIDENGMIYPVANGTAKIYVNYTLGTSVVKKAVTVSVKIPAFTKTSLTIKAGKAGKVAIKNKPKAVAVIYQSSNANVASVDPSTGKVFGVSAGPAEIIATIDGEIYRYSVVVTP